MRSPQARCLGYFGERSVAVVVKQVTLTQSSNEYIVVPVVVVVAGGDTQTKHGNGQPCPAGHVAEGSVLIVVVELGRSRAHLGVPGPVFTVDQQNVGIAVIVVIDEGAAGAHGFRQVFFSEGGIVVGEANASLGGDVTERDVLGMCRHDRQQDRSSG